jgi:transposase InsO family protein
VSPSKKRAAVAELQLKFATSERRACGVLGIPRSTQRYVVQPRTDEVAICQRLRTMVRQRPRFGYRRLTQLLKREGWNVNSKRIHRLCRSEGLKVRQTVRNKRAIGVSANACDVRKAEHKDHVWTWDFVFDRTTNGTALKWLSLIDEHTRECLALKVERGLTSEDVINTLAELFHRRGVPRCIRSDNGPEFISKAIRAWLERLGIEVLYIAPGSPWENGYVESFHSKFRDEFLDRELFENLKSTQAQTANWRDDYNHHRPHSSLNYQTPAEFAARCVASATKRAEAAPLPASPLQPPNGPSGSAQTLPPRLS